MNYKFDGSKVFFTSDTHFYHGNIIRFCNRPFEDVEMMNETISPVGIIQLAWMILFFTWVISVWAVQLNGLKFLID